MFGISNGKLLVQNGKVCTGCCGGIDTCGCSPSSDCPRLKLTISWTEDEWTISTGYAQGVIVRYTDPTAPNPYYLFIKTSAGIQTSDATAPTWDTTIGNTTTEAGSGITWLRIINTHKRQYHACYWSNGESKEMCGAYSTFNGGAIYSAGNTMTSIVERWYRTAYTAGQIFKIAENVRNFFNQNIGNGQIAGWKQAYMLHKRWDQNQAYGGTRVKTNNFNVRVSYAQPWSQTLTGCTFTTQTVATYCAPPPYSASCFTYIITNTFPTPCAPTLFPGVTATPLSYELRNNMKALTNPPSIALSTQKAALLADVFPVTISVSLGGIHNHMMSQNTDNIGVTYKWRKMSAAEARGPGIIKNWRVP